MSDQFGNQNPPGGPDSGGSSMGGSNVPPPGSPAPQGGLGSSGSPGPQGGFAPPSSSADLQSGFATPGSSSGMPAGAPPAAPSGSPMGAPPGMPPGTPAASGYNPAAAVGQWAPQSYGSTNLGNQPPASVGARFGARLIDSILLFVIGFIPALIAFGAVAGTFLNGADITTIQADPELEATLAPAFAFTGLAIFLPIYLINEVVMVKLKGWNLGKLVLGLRVVDADTGEFLSWGKTFKRFLIYYGPQLAATIIGAFVAQLLSTALSIASFLWLIVLLVSIDRGGALLQGWHDKAAGSKVVKKAAF